MFLDISTIVSVMGLSAVAVFAISGALDAARQKMDILGFLLIGTVTGIGGGTLRDMLLGNLPVFWVREPEWIAICLISSGITYFVAARLESLHKSLVWMDAIGISLFAVVGTEIALEFGVNPLIAICMGVMTASFGGIARDVLCGNNLTLMMEELYITPTVIGATVYYGLSTLDLAGSLDLIGGFIVAFALRALGILFNVKLPNIYRES